MGADKRSPEGRGTVTRRKIRLRALCPEGKYPDNGRKEEICLDTLRLEGKCPSTRHMEGIYCGRHRPDATYLDTRCPEEICADTLHLEGKCPGTRHPEGIFRGRHHPDATYLDTHHLEEICLDTLRLEDKMPWRAMSGRNTS